MNNKIPKVFVLGICIIIIVSLAGSLLNCAPAAQTSKKMVIAVNGEPTTLDFSMAGSAVGMPILLNVYDMLFSRSTSGDLVPGILTSWKASDDGKQIDCTLREGVKFHTGDILTAKDVVFSMERAKKSWQYSAAMRLVDKIDIIDDYHFKLLFTSPDVGFIPASGFPIVCKSYFDRVGEDKFGKLPSGTGPYKVVDYAAGQYIDVALFDGYYGKLPSIKTAIFKFVAEDTTRIAMLKTGEADLILECPFPLVKDIENTPDLKIINFKSSHPSPSIIFQNVNTKAPWYDKRVRFAMAYAIDTDAILKGLLLGLPSHWAMLAPWDNGYDSDLKPYPYDPNKSKQLLAEAGYPNGFEMPFYYSIGRMAMQKETAEAIILYLNKVGIKANAQGLDFAKIQEKVREVHNKPDSDYVGLNTIPLAGQVNTTSALLNFTFDTSPLAIYKNPEVDKLYLETQRTFDDNKRGEIVKKTMKILYDDCACIPMWNNVSIYAMKKNINFTPTQKNIYALALLKDMEIK